MKKATKIAFLNLWLNVECIMSGKNCRRRFTRERGIKTIVISEKKRKEGAFVHIAFDDWRLKQWNCRRLCLQEEVMSMFKVAQISYRKSFLIVL